MSFLNTGEHRKSLMELGAIYFWTATINSWHHLLKPDHYKDEIVSSLRTLSERGKIDVFGFVIMPNHIHLIWRALELNGKETLYWREHAAKPLCGRVLVRARYARARYALSSAACYRGGIFCGNGGQLIVRLART